MKSNIVIAFPEDRVTPPVREGHNNLMGAVMRTSIKIAVVEDEQDILDLICLHLKKEHFSVQGFMTGGSFLRYLDSETPSLVVLDLMLPDMDGFDICRRIRAKASTAAVPIIILTARSEETEKVLGLELGADDYMVKPFSPRELTARVKAVMRRLVRTEEDPGIIEIENLLKIDPVRYEVAVEGSKVEMTTTEFRILHLLASRMGKVFSRDQILNHLWGNDKIVLDRTVDVHIKHLREKIGKAGEMIKNIRGIGYKMES